MKDTPAQIITLVLMALLMLVVGLILDKQTTRIDRLEAKIALLEHKP